MVITALQRSLGANVQPLKDWLADDGQIRHCSVREKSQQHWQDKLFVLAKQSLCTSATVRDRCRLAMQSGHSGAWLGCTPNRMEGTHMDHVDYKLALQWWLGLPILSPSDVGEKCPQCAMCMDAYGDHAVSCMKNGVSVRHAAIQEWLLTTARKAGVPCSKEAALPDGDRPGDVLFTHWSGGSPLAVDLTVIHPLRLSEARPTPEGVRRTLEAQETAKCRKYSTRCAAVGWAFHPLAFNTFGSTTSQGGQILHRLSRLYAENTTQRATKGERVALFWQTLQVSLFTQLSEQLRATTYTGPQGPVLPVYWVADELGNLPAAAGGAVKRPRWSTVKQTTKQHQPYPEVGQ